MKAEAYEIMERLARDHWWYRARFEILADILARFGKQGGRLLDFGSGTGVYAAALRDAGYDVTTADTSDLALENCGAKGLATIDLRTGKPDKAAFDMALLGDVLEHVEDETALLGDLATAIRPGGILLITVPAYDLLWSGEDFISGHVRRYRKAELLAVLRQAGLTPIWSSYFNTLLLPAIFGAIFAKRLFMPRSMYQPDVTDVSPLSNGLFYRIFASEKHLLRHLVFPAGASIVAVARNQVADA
jgi:SAM-dependent methyltransferase